MHPPVPSRGRRAGRATFPQTENTRPPEEEHKMDSHTLGFHFSQTLSFVPGPPFVSARPDTGHY